MEKTSILIYNARTFLQKCILKQNITDFEAILVKDGNKDVSRRVCGAY